MIINLPRGLSFDLDHLPDNFEEQVKKAFAEYTSLTHSDYTFQDKLMFIDVSVRMLHMEYCYERYEQGQESQRLYSRYNVDRHEEEKIEKILIRLINAVLSYEKGGKHEES